MKTVLVFAVICFVAFTQACQSPASELSFCDNISWEVDDELFTNIQNKGTYIKLMDQAIKKAYDLGKAELQKLGEKHGFELCEDCLNEFKNFLCAGAYPKCGIWPCLVNRLKLFLEKVLAQYGCKLDDVSCIQKNYRDILKDLNNVPLGEFQACYGEFMPSNSMCKGVIDICSCGAVASTRADKVCRFFAATGTTWTQSGDCSGPKGWCNLAERAKRDDSGDDGSFPINANLNLRIGDPPATTVLNIGVDQESELNPPDEGKFSFLEDDTSSASVLAAFAFLYAVVAALLL